MNRGRPGPPGPPGSAGAAPAIGTFIRSLGPVAYWDLQEAAGASSLVDQISALNLTNTGYTAGGTASPLVPSGKHVTASGGATDGLFSAAAITALVGLHQGWSMGGFFSFPANSRGLILALEKDTIAFEGFGFGIGNAGTDTNITGNYQHTGGHKPGIGFLGFSGGTNHASGNVNNFVRRNQRRNNRWHHFMLTLPDSTDGYPCIFVDAEPFYFEQTVDTNHVAFTSAMRVCIGNTPQSPQTAYSCTSGTKFAHMQAFDRPVTQAECQQQIDCVAYANS